MKKGIVMEQHRRYTVMMTKDGAFQKANPITDAEIGAEVSYEPVDRSVLFLPTWKQISAPMRVVAMACVLLLFVMPFLFINNSHTYAYVNIDINPSVELEIDKSLHVQSIQPLNDDASEMMNRLEEYEGKNVEHIITTIMEESEGAGFLENGKNILVGISYAKENANDDSVLINIEKYLVDHQPDWEIATFQVPTNVRKMARQEKKSMNELMAASILEKDEDINDETSKDEEPMNDEDKAIINSFYDDNQNHSEAEDTIEDSSAVEKKEQSSSDEDKEPDDNQETVHPSELKGENGGINSNGRNNGNNGKGNKARHYDNDGKDNKQYKDNKGNMESKENKEINGNKGNNGNNDNKNNSADKKHNNGKHNADKNRNDGKNNNGNGNRN
ncbi:anti-sigma factor domain-containing protein [Virgibacillus byunsanensis]|uniref:Anti-sigma factor domain-containing protein n=1 Tax=Virgibacillus byunsanensis TaxID=570945 RepID=A0ABW3LHV3_9BACI